MLALKKLFYPEVKDICPNCGAVCAITDTLCTKCGKNLDELFEQLPDSAVTHKPHSTAKTWMKPQIINVWYLANSVILVTSLLTPWIIFFSDVIVVRIRLHYVFGFQILLFPIFGSSLIDAISPAIAIYYSFHGIRTVLNIKTAENSPSLKFIPAFLRLLLAGISLASIRAGVGFNSYMSLGYTLVIVGLLSAFLLEFLLLVLGYEQVKEKAA